MILKNEGMNTCVTKCALKNKTHCNSMSLEARMKVANGIYMVGYHYTIGTKFEIRRKESE